MLKFQSGNFALPQYDDESMAGAKPFASFPGNIDTFILLVIKF